MRIFGIVAGIAAVIGLTIFTIVDVTLTEKSRVRGVPKGVWVVIAFIPVIGLVLWFLVGKARPDASGERRTIAPDDDPSFLQTLSEREEQDERIRRLEQELAELDDDPPKE